MTAVATLDVALKAFCIQLNVCVSGVLVIVASLCASLSAVVNLPLTLTLTLLGLL